MLFFSLWVINMKKFLKANIGARNNYITITIAPPEGDDAKAVRIYYPKLIIAAVLCMIICGALYMGLFLRDIVQQNTSLKADNARLLEVNYAQLHVIRANQREIEEITCDNAQIQEKVEHLADLYCEIVDKYKEITEKYILDKARTLASRGNGRDDKGFVSELIGLRNTIIQINSITMDDTSDNSALSDAEHLLDDFARALPDFTPIHGRITDHFGERIDTFTKKQQNHKGLDIAAPYGSDIRAAGKGKVAFAGRRGAYGNLVIIDHGYGITTYYAHASRLLVEEGQQVDKGEVIARIGSTGRSTGPHLHFEVRKNNEPIDPLK